MTITETARPATSCSAPTYEAPAGHTGTLNSHDCDDTQMGLAVEGQDSPQAKQHTAPTFCSPAGSTAAQPATAYAAPKDMPLAGHDTPGDHRAHGTQSGSATGDQVPLAAMRPPAPKLCTLLADNPDELALKALVHPSLRQGPALDRLWGDYRNILGKLEGYEHGMTDWHDFGPDWETAGDNIRGEAEYALLDLIHGIGRGGDAA